MKKEEREFLLKNGAIEEYAGANGVKILLFYGPRGVMQRGGLVGRRGYAVDVTGPATHIDYRNWYDTLDAADRMIWDLRTKDEIDIAREALRLPIRNTPKGKN